MIWESVGQAIYDRIIGWEGCKHKLWFYFFVHYPRAWTGSILLNAVTVWHTVEIIKKDILNKCD